MIVQTNPAGSASSIDYVEVHGSITPPDATKVSVTPKAFPTKVPPKEFPEVGPVKEPYIWNKKL